MTDYAPFQQVSPTTFAELVARDRVMDIGIRPLWPDMPRIAGPAYPVRCAPGDNLMLHAAIYRATPGSIIVVQAGDVDYAVAGGNVCAIAQRHGVAGFVVDGVIRDIAEARANRFPVFGRGVIPIPGGKDVLGTLQTPVMCGGVNVAFGDVIVADEEGVVAVPFEQCNLLLQKAQENAAKEEAETLDMWEQAHHAKIDQILKEKGFTD